MYYIVSKQKEGAYLLDKSQKILWKSNGENDDYSSVLRYWNNIIHNYSINNFYLVFKDDEDTCVKPYLTVLEHN